MKAYILDPLWNSLVTSAQLSSLEEAGIQLVVHNTPSRPTEIKELLEGSDERLLCINPDFVSWKLPKEDFQEIPNLKAILTASTSCGWIDTDFAKMRGIPVCNIRNFSTNSVAEWALLIALSLVRKVPLLIKDKFPCDFTKYQGAELKGRTAGIVGLGNIGRAIAERCEALGMKILYWSQHSRDKRFEFAELPDLFESSDVLFPALADRDETRNIIQDSMIHSMKPTSVFVSLVHRYYNHGLLLKQVQQNKLFGYGFEAADKEHFADFDGNIWAAPPYAWCTDGCMKAAMHHWIKNMIDASRQHFPLCVNR